jgi:hypothetical protein
MTTDLPPAVTAFLRRLGLRDDGTINLAALRLSPEERAARRNFIGGSEIHILVNGDPYEVHRLWRIKTGREEPDDLSDLFHVILGQWTEALNLAWLEKRFSQAAGQSDADFYENGPRVRVTRRGERVYHPRYEWAACTLDGWLEERRRVVQCKHVNAFSKIDAVVERYQPQIQWEALVTGAEGGILSVIVGTNEPEYRDIELDPVYAGQLMELAERFMAYVKSDTPPHDIAPLPVKPAKAPKAIRVGEIAMTGNNEWADAAARWLQNVEAASAFERAAKDLKSLVPAQVARAWGHGVEVKANKAGALVIRPFKEEKE